VCGRLNSDSDPGLSKVSILQPLCDFLEFQEIGKMDNIMLLIILGCIQGVLALSLSLSTNMQPAKPQRTWCNIVLPCQQTLVL
jgi:hypothetical protein